MTKTFFTSKEAARITGCTLRQLQYWREKEVIVPTVNATGTGRSIYYSRPELIKLTLMEYWLSLGLSFEMAQHLLQQLQDSEPEFAEPNNEKRMMLIWSGSEGILRLRDFDRETAIASLDRGQPIIPVWLDRIHQQLNQKLKS
jgi:DNA-binding transcriptional MerR regulator